MKRLYKYILCFICIELFNLGYIYTTDYNAKPQYKTCDKIPEDSKIMETKSGKIKGECYTVPVKYSNEQTAKYDVFTWLGVPYAEAPINENRFKRPLPIKSWNNLLDGTKWRSKCLQKQFLLDETENSIPKIALQEIEISEDCLYLNIYAPSSLYYKESLLLSPIVVFFHGGSFIAGSGSEDFYDPFVFVGTTNIIIVTINFRLGVLGSLHLSESDANGNQGFLDQNMALRWIYDNAISFKGDNSKITLMGHGTGAYSVGHHLFYKPSTERFSNAILLGGSPLNKGIYFFYELIVYLFLIENS